MHEIGLDLGTLSVSLTMTELISVTYMLQSLLVVQRYVFDRSFDRVYLRRVFDCLVGSFYGSTYGDNN